MQRNKNRSIPITKTSQDLYMLEQAKLRVQNEFLNEHSVMAKRDDRYNVHLYDVIDQEEINKNVDVACNSTKIIPTRFDNKSKVADHNIALYNGRDDEEINNEILIGNVLPERLRAMADNKITTPNAWMKDYAYIKHAEAETGIPDRFLNENFKDYGYGFDDVSAGDYNGYLSSLIPSETNRPEPMASEPYDAPKYQPNAAMFPDERLQRNLQTQQRQIKDEGSRVIDAINLRNSEYIKERNARQAEMETMMNHRGQMKLPMIKTQDYIDFLDEQNNGLTSNYYTYDEQFTGSINRFNERNPGGLKGAFKTQQNPMPSYRACSVSGMRGTQDARDEPQKEDDGRIPLNKNIFRQQEIYEDIDEEDEITNDLNKVLYVYDESKGGYIPVIREAKHRADNNYDCVDGVDDIVYDENEAIPEIVEEDTTKSYFISDKTKFNDRGIEDIDKTQQQRNSNPISKYPLLREIFGEGWIKKEAFNQANHILIMRKGDIKSVYTNPNSESTAPVLITLDTNNKPVRVCATMNNNSIYVIRKRDPSYVDIQTGTLYNDDYTVLKIPIEQVSDSIKRRITEQKRQKKSGFRVSNHKNPELVINLEYNDLVDLAETMNENLDKCKRVKVDSMASYLRDKEFDKNIIFGIKDDSLFSTPFTLNEIEKNERLKNETTLSNETKISKFKDLLKNGSKDWKHLTTLFNPKDDNDKERLKADTTKSRIDKLTNENFQDFRPTDPHNFDTWKKQGATGRANDYHNKINYRNGQIGHYYQFEEY